jgi:hypothetical protein
MSWNVLEVAWNVGLFVEGVVVSCQLFFDYSIALAVYLYVNYIQIYRQRSRLNTEQLIGDYDPLYEQAYFPRDLQNIP